MLRNKLIPKWIICYLLICQNPSLAQKKVASDFYNFKYVVTYNLKYHLDSSQKEATSLSKQLLLINDSISLTGSHYLLDADTSVFNFLENPKMAQSSKSITTHLDDIKYRILKEKETITTYDAAPNVLHQPVFKYQESKTAFAWQLESDTATIAGFLCQKAVCSFGGRFWTAWFTNKIPINDGPYKFCGLPGLIIKVYDSSNSWIYELASFVNSDYKFPRNAIFASETNTTLLSITKPKYLKRLKQNYSNAYGLILSYNSSQSNITESDKEMYDRWSKNIQKKNNWIELYESKD